MKTLLLVGIGGFLGSVARYSLHLFIIRLYAERAYLGTLIVNLLGCFIIGLLGGNMTKLSNQQSLLLVTGFCGGFTTFSTFAIDGFKLMKDGLYVQLIVYYALSVLGGLALCFGGFYLVNKG